MGLTDDDAYDTLAVRGIELEEEEFISDVPFYTHNWPYDHFSLVELAEIETNITFGKIRQKPTPTVGEPPEQTPFEAVKIEDKGTLDALVEDSDAYGASPAGSGLIRER